MFQNYLIQSLGNKTKQEKQILRKTKKQKPCHRIVKTNN